MRRFWQLFLTRILYWRLRAREQENGITHGLLLQMGRILDYDTKAQALYLAAGRKGEKETQAYYEGQRRLIEWIINGKGTKSGPTRSRVGDSPRSDDD
jgi:hypothetical protein